MIGLVEDRVFLNVLIISNTIILFISTINLIIIRYNCGSLCFI